MDQEHLRFPLGRFEKPLSVTGDKRSSMVNTIRAFPDRMHAKVQYLDDESLARTYREGGWNVRQLVHHCADSHMNAFIRFKITLTEENPTIRPYMEALWAEQHDNLKMAVTTSLRILDGVHARWAFVLEHMSDQDYKRSYVHPEHDEVFTLEQALANYDWHCRHHYRHIEIALTGT